MQTVSSLGSLHRTYQSLLERVKASNQLVGLFTVMAVVAFGCAGDGGVSGPGVEPPNFSDRARIDDQNGSAGSSDYDSRDASRSDRESDSDVTLDASGSGSDIAPDSGIEDSATADVIADIDSDSDEVVDSGIEDTGIIAGFRPRSNRTDVCQPLIVIPEQNGECEWKLPNVPESETFDGDRVNLGISSQSRGDWLIVRASFPGSCDGWYYDDWMLPSSIVLCPEICSAIDGLEPANVEILLGCATMVAL